MLYNNSGEEINSNKNTIIAFILNFIAGVFIPGIGQIYLGLTKKGIMLIVAYWIFGILSIIANIFNIYFILGNLTVIANVLSMVVSVPTNTPQTILFTQLLFWLEIIVGFIIYVYALVDSLISGQSMNNGEYVEDSLFGFSF